MERRSSHSLAEQEAIREAARKKGFEEGLEAGMRKGESSGYMAGIKRGREAGETVARTEVLELEKKAIADFQAQLSHLSDLNQAAIDQWAKAAERALLDRVMAITRHVLAQELTLSRESLIPMVASAVREVANARTARVRVNPFDRHLLADRKEELMSLSQNLQHLEIVDDPAIIGGAIVETEGGRVDATIEGKLISLETELARAEGQPATIPAPIEVPIPVESMGERADGQAQSDNADEEVA
jgi:flagellar assembly protein FliH